MREFSSDIVTYTIKRFASVWAISYLIHHQLIIPKLAQYNLRLVACAFLVTVLTILY